MRSNVQQVFGSKTLISIPPPNVQMGNPCSNEAQVCHGADKIYQEPISSLWSSVIPVITSRSAWKCPPGSHRYIPDFLRPPTPGTICFLGEKPAPWSLILMADLLVPGCLSKIVWFTFKGHADNIECEDWWRYKMNIIFCTNDSQIDAVSILAAAVYSCHFQLNLMISRLSNKESDFPRVQLATCLKMIHDVLVQTQ